MADYQETFDIKQEYLQNTELKCDDINTLRQWVETRTSSNSKTSDFLLFLCLHSCYYNLDRAKNTIISYHNLRAEWPEVFKNKNPKVMPFSLQLDVAVVWPLKQGTKEGYTVFLLRLVDYDANNYDLDGQIKLFFIVIDYWLAKMQGREGIVLIFDNKGASWSHLLKYSLNSAKKIVAYVQEAFPVRLKSIHFINVNSIVDKVLFITRIFMNKELNNMIHVHTNLETLYECVPKSCLPKDYGGDDVTIQDLHGNMKEALLANYKFFLEEGERELNKEVADEWQEFVDSIDVRL